MASLLIEYYNSCLGLAFSIVSVLLYSFLLYKRQIYNRKIYFFLIFSILILVEFLGVYRGYLYKKDFSYIGELISTNENDSELEWQGNICKKEFKNSNVIYYVNNISSSNYKFCNSIKMMVYTDSDSYSIGDKIKYSGSLKDFSIAKNEGNFDEKSYYQGLGVCGKIKNSSIVLIKNSLGFREGIFILQQAMKAQYEYFLPGEEASIASAMSLGDKSDLELETKELFQLSGLAHILAISGLHISIVGSGVYKLLRKFRLGINESSLVSVFLVLIYCVLCGSSLSTLRACIMFTLMMIANILGQAYDFLTALSLSGIILIISNPFYIFSASFVFSFVIVAGIYLIVRPISDKYEEFCRIRFKKIHYRDTYIKFSMNFKEKLISNLISSICLQLISIPLVANYYFEIPTYSFALNILIIPFMGILLSFLLIGSLLGCLGIEMISGLLMKFCHCIIYLYESLASNSQKLFFSSLITGKPSICLIILYYFLLFLLVRKISKIKIKEDYYSKVIVEKESLRNCRINVIGFSVILAVLIFFPLFKGFEIDMIDVGQGDGIYIHTSEGYNLYIDGGSTSIDNVGKYNILPYLKYNKVRHIDYWFVTHTDQDHVSGLIEALQYRYKIKYIIFDDYMNETDNYKTIKNLAAENGTEILFMNKGDKISFKDTSISCLWPADASKVVGDESDVMEVNSLAVDSDIDSTDINSQSLVLLYKDKNFKGIFTGDITSQVEEELMSAYPTVIKDLDLLKVAHHGSKTATSEAWLDKTNPSYCIISAGENNSYGHPSYLTLQRLNDAKVSYACTIQSGRIKVTYDKKIIINKYIE